MLTEIKTLGSSNVEEEDSIFLASEAANFVAGDKNRLDAHGDEHIDPSNDNFIPIAIANTAPGLLSGTDKSKLDLLSDTPSTFFSISSFCPNVLTDAYIALVYYFVFPITFPVDLDGSICKAETAATASTVFSIKKDGVEVGTITFGIGSATGVFSFATEVTFDVGSKLSVVGPATADVTLADVSISLRGNRYDSSVDPGIVYVGDNVPIVEVIKSESGTLDSTEIKGTIINNYGQLVENTQTLPTASEGINFIFLVSTIDGGDIHLKAGANNKFYFDGVALDDGDKITNESPSVGDFLSVWAFKTGATSYDFIAESGRGFWIDGGQ